MVNAYPWETFSPPAALSFRSLWRAAKAAAHMVMVSKREFLMRTALVS